jgi:sugar phosphate isomerase/epimerase
MPLPVALQMYSVRDELSKDYKATLEKVKAMGYDYVELAGFGGKSVDEIKKLYQDAGLSIISAHVAISELLEDTKKTLLEYASLGCSYIAIPWLEEERRPGHKGFEPTIQDILNIGRIAKEMGMSLLYHNHDFEFVTIDGKYALDILYETIPADILQSEIDTCWVHFAGVNPVEYLKKFKGRAPVVHLKDFTADDTSSSDTPYDLIMSNAPKKTREESHFKFQPLGYGKQDIPSLLEACEYVGAKYVIVEQDVSTDRTGLEDAEISRNTLKKYGW